MGISEGISQSFDVIASNKARSLLTMLGITFGVGCLIAIAIVGLAFRDSIGSEFGRYGSTLVWVQPNWSAYASNEPGVLLNERDISYFTTALPGLTESSSIFRSNEPISYRGESMRSSVLGVDPDHFVMFAIDMDRGRTFLPQDVDLRRNVCVLRPDIATRLFHDEDPVGRTIRIGERYYTVLGVTERLEQGFLGDGSDNNSVFVPDRLVASRIWGAQSIKYGIYVMKFDSTSHVDVALNRTEGYLQKKYGLLRGEERFTVRRLDTYIQIAERVLSIVSTLVLLIAAISLVVGGLGITNIMLVTVTERTREIGVRVAVGANRRDIMSQFVIEAITLCLMGGAAGVLLGTGLAAIACAALTWKLTVSAPIVLGALGVSSAIGLVFGIYPAHRASKLTPIEALRAET